IGPAGRRHRLLLVEDHTPLAEAMAEFMRSQGLEVCIASTGMQALEIATTFKPEIVLCDLRLPDMAGLDVARALRATPLTKYALIAMHTALTDSDLRALKRLTDASVNVFLSKPLTQEKLDSLLSQLEVLQRSAAEA